CDPDRNDVEVLKVEQLSNGVRKWRPSEGRQLIYTADDVYKTRDDFRVMLNIVNRMSNCIHRPDEWPWRNIFLSPIENQTPVEFLQRLNDAGFPAQLPPYER
ncbi:MAG: hypothetical protein WBA68_02040, partial [Alteraurantiacibacter sp.]